MSRSVIRLAAIAVNVAAGACGAFGADYPGETADGGGDGGGGDAPSVPDGPAPEASADGGGSDACTPPCADTLVADMGENIRSLACAGQVGGALYAGLPGVIRSVNKATGAISPAGSFTARHMSMESPLVYTSGTSVRRLQGNNPIVVSGQDVRGIQSTPAAWYWSRRTPDEILFWPRGAEIPDGGLLFANLPELGEGLLVRGLSLYVALPSMQRVLTFSLDGGVPGEDIVTNDDVYALAHDGTHLYWVTPTARKIRYVAWNATETIFDLVDATGTTGPMESVCVDQTHVYFGVGTELHRVPAAP